MNHVTDDTFVYFTILGRTLTWVVYLLALVLAHKCLITPMRFARQTLTWIFDFNDSNEVSQSAIMWMTNFKDLLKTVATFFAYIISSMIMEVQDDMNSFSHVHEQVLVCLSKWIFLNPRGLMNCRKLVWISYVNGTCYYEIEKIVHVFVLR